MSHFILDGENYYLHYPYAKAISELNSAGVFKALHEQQRMIVEADTRIGFTPENESGLVIAKCYDKQGRINVTKDPFKMHEVVSYVPMLIPKDRNYRFDTSLTINPNGTKTRGFTMYVNDKPYPFPETPCDALTFNHEQISFGDTTGDNEYDIEWIYWNGVLICSKALIHLISPYFLKRQGLHDFDRIPKWED